ncbi:MAG: PA0069 family radical SAM protein [Pseudomonadota bacterium]
MFYFVPMILRPEQKRPARGATTNAAGRFEPHDREAVSDGWDIDEDLPPLRTEVRVEAPRKIITRNTSPDISFDRSVNPYRGCEHGCIYCYARPTHGYLGLSAGLDFETRLTAKPDAPARLAKEISAAGYTVAPIAFGTNTDAYQPVEKEWKIMRGCLEVLRDFRHPLTIATKGTLIERDIDILGPMAAEGLVQVGVSVTTLDPKLSRQMEPRVPVPARRLAAIRALAEAGIPVRVMASPMIPGLTDHEMERILEAARDHGATAASWIMLRLPFEVSGLFRDWLEAEVPLRKDRVMSHIRDARGGKDYDAEWGKRMRGEGPYADLMAHRFKVATRRLGLTESLPDVRCDLFTVPPRAGDQLSLF